MEFHMDLICRSRTVKARLPFCFSVTRNSSQKGLTAMFTRCSPNSRHMTITPTRLPVRGRRLMLSLVALSLLAISAVPVRSQQLAPNATDAIVASDPTKRTESLIDQPSGDKKPATIEEKLTALEQVLDRQSQRLDELQRTVNEQQELIRLLAGKSNPTSTSPAVLAVRMETEPQPTQTPGIEDRLKKV